MHARVCVRGKCVCAHAQCVRMCSVCARVCVCVCEGEVCVCAHVHLWAGNLNFIAIILRTDTEMWTYIYKKDIYCRIYYSDQLDIN